MICYTIHGQLNPTQQGEENNALLNLIKSQTYLKPNEVHQMKKGQVRFDGYANYRSIDALEEAIAQNINLINEGQVFFQCFDEDGIDSDPFPFIEFFEISDSILHKQALFTRLNCQWDTCEEDIVEHPQQEKHEDKEGKDTELPF